MTGVVIRLFGDGEAHYAIRGGSFDPEGLLDFLLGKERGKESFLLMATTLALASFMGFLEKKRIRLRAPSGSRIMETGGFKGRHREIPPRRKLSLIGTYLGVPPQRVVDEYGMTELTSQFYGAASSEKAIPPWTRVTVVDPGSGKDVPLGKRGILRIFDLANQGSVIAIQTEDEGRRTAGGFELLGRRKGSDLRGCSLTFEEMEAAAPLPRYASRGNGMPRRGQAAASG